MKKNSNSAATAGVVIGAPAYFAGISALVATRESAIAAMHTSEHLPMSAGAGTQIVATAGAGAAAGGWPVAVPQAARFRRAECASVSKSRYRARAR